VIFVTVFRHARAALAPMTTPGVPKRVSSRLQCGLGTALAPAGLSTAVPRGCVLVLTAGRVVPGCAVEASAATGAAESTVAAMTAVMRFRRMDILLLSLISIWTLRRGGVSAIEMRTMILPFPSFMPLVNGCPASSAVALPLAAASRLFSSPVPPHGAGALVDEPSVAKAAVPGRTGGGMTGRSGSADPWLDPNSPSRDRAAGRIGAPRCSLRYGDAGAEPDTANSDTANSDSRVT